MKKNSTRNTIYKIIGISGMFLMGTMLLLVCQGGFDVMETWMIRTLMNAVQNNQNIIGMCALLSLLILAEGIVGGLSGVLIGKTMILGRKKIQLYLVNQVLNCHYNTLSEMGTGEILTRLQTDSAQCVESIRYFLQTIVYGGVLLAWPVLICFFISWQLTLLSVFMVPFIFLFSKKFSVKIGAATEKLQTQEGKANKVFQEYIWQIPVNKAYCAKNEWDNHLDKILEETYRVKNKKIFFQLLYEPFLNIVQILPQILILIVGGCLLIRDEITIGDLLLFTIFLGYIANGMFGISQWVADWRQFSVHKKRVNEIVNIPFFFGKNEIKKEMSDIVLKDMEFSYSNGKFVLKQISLNVERGMHVALVGESGCGKTTLLKILAGLNRPQKGYATVLGYDLLQCQPERLYSGLALILQETYLFPGTIRENLIAGNTEILQEQLECACRKTNIWDWISSLPQGLDTVLTEFSSNISGGQKQRIGIARAILHNADLWLMDEPTSSLDYQTAQDILKNLQDITKECTTVMVVHDLHNMSQYDLIVVMENGRLAESGTHDVLLKKEGLYAELYKKGRQKHE